MSAASTDLPRRRATFTEVAIVVLVAFGTRVLLAATDLATHIGGATPPPTLLLLAPAIPWLNVLDGILYWALLTTPAALAVWLVLNAGGGLADLGIVRPSPWDALAALALLVVAGLGSTLANGILLQLTHGAGVFAPRQVVGLGRVDLVLISLNAGVLEETVVLAYVIRRLESAGVRTRNAALVSLGLRASYHLYYGTGVVAILVFGLVQTAYFVRFRRLLPAILGHSAWDIALTLR